jgi:transcriptional regulator with XRE-family HTH domain
MTHYGLTQADLQRLTGLSQAAIHNHLNGVSIPGKEAMPLYIAKLNVNEAWLVGRVDHCDANISLDVDIAPPRYRATRSTDYVVINKNNPVSIAIPKAPGALTETHPLPSEKNIATQPAGYDPGANVLIPIQDALRIFETTQDEFWRGKGLWYDARDLHGEDFRKRLDNYVKVATPSKEDKKQLATNITTRLTYLGVEFSLDELAHATGYAVNTLKKYIQLINYPAPRAIFAIAAALRMTPHKLESGIRSKLETTTNSGGVTYRRDHPNVDAILGINIPALTNVNEEHEHLKGLAKNLYKVEGVNGGPMTEGWENTFIQLGWHDREVLGFGWDSIYGNGPRDPSYCLNLFIEDFCIPDPVEDLAADLEGNLTSIENLNKE